MLYKLGQTNGIPDNLIPLKFGNFDLEKHLENLMADKMAGVLFEDNEMMPIFRERQQQPEADIYALNVHYLGKNDIVFLYHKNQGIIAAGKVVTNKAVEDTEAEAFYHGLEWLTAKPAR